MVIVSKAHLKAFKRLLVNGNTEYGLGGGRGGVVKGCEVCSWGCFTLVDDCLQFFKNHLFRARVALFKRGEEKDEVRTEKNSKTKNVRNTV